MNFPPIVRLILGAILAAIQAVQMNVTISTQAHDAITLVAMVLAGLGILAATPAIIEKYVPHAVLVVITTVFGALQIVQTSSFHIGRLFHTIIAVVLIIGTALFVTNPATQVVKKKV